MHRSLSRGLQTLRDVLSSKIEEKRVSLSFLKSSSLPVDDIKVLELLDGMKSMKTMLCETSRVDSGGVKYRGYPLSELISLLPSKHKQPNAESVLWLLLTGEIPSYEQCDSLIDELSSISSLPKSTEDLLFSLPREMHPMTQLSIGILSLSEHSAFALSAGPASEQWKPMLDDSLYLIAKLPRMAGIVYRHTFKDNKVPAPGRHDLAENLGRMMGWTDQDFFEALRLYFFIHCDHEGGNVSTHCTKLVGSAGNSAFYSYSAGVNGLAGPIHGLGIQFCLMWLVDLWKILGNNIDEQAIEVYVRSYLKHHEKIPGFGHPVLRHTDTRFTVQLEFAQRHMKDNELCEIIRICSHVVPRVMKEMGMKNRFPNMYLHSGGILYHYGLRMYEFYAVLFAVARALGALSNLVWDRALMLDMERPDSVTIEELEGLQ